MAPIIKWELRSRKTAIIWWSVSAIAIVALILLIYPPLRDQADQFNKVINQLPDGLRQLKAGTTGRVDVADPVDFLNSQLYYLTLPILLIILTIGRGASLIGRDEREHTIELLLARPISRGKLLAGKALAGIFETFIVSAIATLFIIVLAKPVKIDVDTMRLLITSLYMWLFCLSFGAIAFALTAVGRFTKRASTGIAVFASFGSYLLATLSGLNDTVAKAAKLFPYHYFAPDKILRGDNVTGLNVYLIGIFIITTIVAYVGFRHRDID